MNRYLAHKARQPRYGAWLEAESEGGWFSSPKLKKMMESKTETTITYKPQFYESKAFKIGLISLLLGGVALVGFRSLRIRS
jgi:hypothetical protein